MDIVHCEGKGFYIYGENREILAELEYKMKDDILVFDHTEVSDKLKGQGIAAKLLDEATKYARENKLKVKAECSYVVKKFETGAYDDIKI
ncbi:MAG: GNAT family N-acetyltransferase [Fusobacterium sp.]|uniref:GNAT family N-acetyltransferase n=1 Tax=Fusobacterium sp. TaxID=68766 RepID=UPI0026DAC97A|nr:GNAT family N-acetyltransferase [Fusobacterium sp.]MDO4689862.1 GNAT family N-acetyltransferase [Fusobacterium sp.]